MFALRDLRAGETLWRGAPVVAHPPHGRADVCHHCLRALAAAGAAPVTRAGKRLCSAACADDAERRYLSAQAAARLDAFEADAAARDELHPLLVARLACAVASGAAHPSTLDGLCFARGAVAHPPAAWLAAHAALRGAFDAARLRADFLTAEWYVGALARLHLNAFRVDLPRADVADLAALARVMNGA